MKRRPIIGIISAKHDYGMVLPVYDTTGHYLEQTEAAGGVPVQLPLLAGVGPEVLDEMVSLCDGFLLPGGGDFAPQWYGQEPLPGLKTGTSVGDQEMERTALTLVRAMAGSGKPILGICLGAQAINIALGGDLYQDLPTQLPSDITHAMPAKAEKDRWKIAHTVKTAEGSLIRSLTGAEEIQVNSFHHQAVKTPAPGFTATAFAPDGVIETIESENKKILGIQWHPENLAQAGNPQGKAIFQWLVRQASGNAEEN